MRRRTYLIIPEPPTGYVLNPCRGPFSIIVPIQRTNEVTNPSAETNTTNYTAGAGTLARSTEQQYHGAYSLKYTPSAALNDGFFYGTISMTAGQTRAISCKWFGAANVPYKLSVATTAGVDLVTYRFIGTGRWQWVWLYWTETSTTTRRLYFTKNNSASVQPFYIDGVQSEQINAGETVSTYIDGDQLGLLPNQVPYPYYWTGTPHASTSVRLATTRAGGYVLNFDRFRYRVIGWVGLGITAVANIVAIPAAADGGTYQSTLARPRPFAINGFFDAPGWPSLEQARSDLYSLIGPDSASPRQPLKLLYQLFDGRDERSAMGTIVAAYEHGLEGNTSSPHRDTAPISFTAYLPTIQAGDDGAELAVQQSVSNANRIIQRSANGTWSAMGTGAASSDVHDFAIGLDGKIYATGAFSGMGGVANTAGIAYWDGSAWNAMGTGLSGGVGDNLAVGPDGAIYVGGTFTSAGGVANTTRIAKWNGSAWSALSTGANGTVSALAFGFDGTLYVGGGFTTIGGVAVSSMAKWNGSAFSAVGAGAFSSAVQALACGLDGSIYAGGVFTTIGALTANGIAKWDGSAWSALGSGVSGGGVRALAVAPNGSVFVGGDFTAAGGGFNANSYVAFWDGANWQNMGGLYPNAAVEELFFDRSGILWVGGQFSGIFDPAPTTSTGLMRWAAGAWLPPDVTLPATVVAVYAVADTPDGRLFVGWDGSAGTATAAGITTAANTGTARVFPTIRITGPSSGTARIYQIVNTTNGQALYLNLIINAGEVIMVRPSANGTRIESNVRGLLSPILPGSGSTIALEKGSNTVSLFTNSSTVTAQVWWPVMVQSTSDLAAR